MKDATEVIEIEGDQSEEDNGCFSLDFDKCSKCKKDFPSHEAAMQHYNHKHPDEMQMCPECNTLLSNSRQISYHFKTKHPTVMVPLYLKSSRALGYAKTMFEQFTANRCTICKLEFKTKAETHSHFKEDHDLEFHSCSACSKSFRFESALLTHWNSTHWAQRHTDLEFAEYDSHIPMVVSI